MLFHAGINRCPAPGAAKSETAGTPPGAACALEAGHSKDGPARPAIKHRLIIRPPESTTSIFSVCRRFGLTLGGGIAVMLMLARNADARVGNKRRLGRRMDLRASGPSGPPYYRGAVGSCTD